MEEGIYGELEWIRGQIVTKQFFRRINEGWKSGKPNINQFRKQGSFVLRVRGNLKRCLECLSEPGQSWGMYLRMEKPVKQLDEEDLGNVTQNN